jgi:hypothetical protein
LALLGPLLLSSCGKDEPVLLNTAPVGESDASSNTDDTDDGASGGGGGAGGLGGRVPVAPSAGGTPSVTPPPTGPSPIGRVCDLDGDCPEGLRCMLPSSDEWLGGGPAHGYCTMDCISDPSVCALTDPSALCLQLSDTDAYCMQGCVLGAVAKCQGRGDVACDSASIDTGFCRPTCRSAEDCGGRLCDLGTGACVDELPAGDPIGSECDPNAEVSSCQSQICLPMTDSFAVCSGWCNLAETGCGLDNDIPEDPGEPICTFGVLQGSGLGDLGYCNQRCDCDLDCLHPGGRCLIVPDDIAEVFGTDGLCVDPEFPDDDPEFIVGRECPPGYKPGPADSGAGTGDSGVDAAAPMSSLDATAPISEPDSATTADAAPSAPAEAPSTPAEAPSTPVEAPSTPVEAPSAPMEAAVDASGDR